MAGVDPASQLPANPTPLQRLAHAAASGSLQDLEQPAQEMGLTSLLCTPSYLVSTWCRLDLPAAPACRSACARASCRYSLSTVPCLLVPKLAADLLQPDPPPFRRRRAPSWWT